jgi:pyridoxine/pyridoxamine 5'-phosphate oxidase
MVVISENTEDIVAFIEQHPVVGIATAGVDGDPDAAVVYCVVGADNTFEFITLRQTVKGQHLLENPRISLVAFDALKSIAAKISGSVEEITDVGDQTALFNKVLLVSQQASDGNLPPVTQMHAGEFVFYRLNPEHSSITAFA